MRRSRDKWVEIIRVFEKSKLTQEAFAEERNLPVGTLRTWIYRLRHEEKRSTAGDEAVPILPVRVIASTAPLARQPSEDTVAAIEVAVGESVRLRFPPSTPPSVIAELVVLLVHQC